ncbi:TAXI family TRAP transporter solute-binding subunit [Pikeienuella piscinae]|uniref:TAXI family TRAP transporter solute-binding subunit n=1 Tax=Pikeienuella piscinae TaxID=2748098 RepID=A0A7L5C3X1_9RHOB|nr:TAXI family TRAP transporter solute-binding subunit [Pikeienuella piscinae]QIE56609.1 TAXI family TRAP transporter solute-binding subunit [Pikeienuella piscinae]
MTKFRSLKGTLAAALAAVAVFGAAGAGAQEKTHLKMDTLAPGSSAYVFAVAVTNVVQKHLPYEIQVSSGKSAVRMAIDAAKGQVDLYLASMAVNQFMENGEAMFKNSPEAPELFAKLRGIINYPIGAYYMVTYADSGIETLKDIKGKRVFLGPPKGAARVVTGQIVKGVAGYEPGVDFEEAKLDWNSAQQAFQDGQLDVYMGLTSIPSPQIEQFATSRKLRLLGIPAAALESDDVMKALNPPGRTIESIPPEIYGDRLVNTAPVATVGSQAGLATHIGVDEEVVYQLTKAIFENLDEFHANAAWLSQITPETVFTSMNFPLHAGAYRYFHEIGLEVPEELIPPEAQ